MKKNTLGLCAFMIVAGLSWSILAQNTTAQIAPPTDLQPVSGSVLPASTTTVTLSWSAVSGAAGYLLRATDLTDSTLRYSGNTDNMHGYVFIDGYQGNRLSLPVYSGHAYKFWMHAMAPNFSYSDPSTCSSSIGTTFFVASSSSDLVASRSLSASASSVAPGQIISVAVMDKPATSSDWVALAQAGSTTTHIPGFWLYLNGSQTEPSTPNSTATLTFAMPTAQGQYEFRLYADNNGTVLARSGSITVGPSTPTPPTTPPPPLVPILTALATTATAGGTLSLSFIDSQATVGDWIGLAQAGSTTPCISGTGCILGAPDPAFQPGHQRHADLRHALHSRPV